MARRRSRFALGRRVAALAVILLVHGCASTGYDASSLQRELVDAGLTERQAACVTERLEDHFDPQRLSSHVDPARREVARTRLVLRSCGVEPRPR
jgi:hypothetical protein